MSYGGLRLVLVATLPIHHSTEPGSVSRSWGSGVPPTGFGVRLVWRGSIAVTRAEVRRHLCVETQRQWAAKAISVVPRRLQGPEQVNPLRP